MVGEFGGGGGGCGEGFRGLKWFPLREPLEILGGPADAASIALHQKAAWRSASSFLR